MARYAVAGIYHGIPSNWSAPSRYCDWTSYDRVILSKRLAAGLSHDVGIPIVVAIAFLDESVILEGFTVL